MKGKKIGETTDQKVHNERELFPRFPTRLARRSTFEIGVISYSINYMLQRFPSSIFKGITFPFNQEMGGSSTRRVLRAMLQNRTHKEFLLTINIDSLGWYMMPIIRVKWSQLANMEDIMALPMSR